MPISRLCPKYSKGTVTRMNYHSGNGQLASVISILELKEDVRNNTGNIALS